MSDGWIPEREKAVPRKKHAWFVDLSLVSIYSLFLVGCFFIAFAHRNLADMQTWSWISFLLVILVSLSLSYVLYDLKKTLAIFFLCSLSGFVLTSFISVALFFHSYTTYFYRTGPDPLDLEIVSPAQLIMVFIIDAFFINILGTIAGNYIAERTRRGEKVLSLRCLSCGTWNEQDALKCSFCGKELIEERYAAEKEKKKGLL